MQAVRVTNEVERINMKGRDGGEPWQLVKQKCILDQGDGLGFVFAVTIPNGESPYTPGEYHIDPQSYVPGRFDRIELDARKLRLLPIRSVAQAKAS